MKIREAFNKLKTILGKKEHKIHFVWSDTGAQRDPYLDMEDRDRYPDIERMVAELLLDDHLFVNSTGSLCVLCSDTFDWGCADFENITLGDLPTFYKVVTTDKSPGYAATLWCCIKRGKQPISVVKQRMRDLGLWSEELEKLEPNNY